MTRTIKFRGQSVLNSTWLYGCLLKIGNNYHILNSNDMCIQILAGCGLIEEDIEYLKEKVKEDIYFETNGFSIDETILGIKVVGNIHTKKGDNPYKT